MLQTNVQAVTAEMRLCRRGWLFKAAACRARYYYAVAFSVMKSRMTSGHVLI